LLYIRYPFGELRITDDLLVSLDGKTLEPQARRLREMYCVLYDPKAVDKVPSDTVLYCMYRDAILKEHLKLFRKKKVRFDITVIAPMVLGGELNKTLGHYHPKAVDNLSYPEIYQVLWGHASYLLQKKEGGAISDFRIIEVGAGDTLLIPPNYGHVTVNSGETPLVMANLVSDASTSVYEDYVSKGGAAYYLLKGGRLVPNPRYGQLPEPRSSKERFTVSKDLYTDFISCPNCYSYLNDPSELEKLIPPFDRG
jgi:glucose-6-phosphate isomerase